MTRPTAADRIADLTAEVDQQRTRAEAAEAELREVREVRKLIATMEDDQRSVEAERKNLIAANDSLRERIGAARPAVVKLRMSLADLQGIADADYLSLRAAANRINDILAGRTAL